MNQHSAHYQIHLSYHQKASMEEPRVIINDPTGRFILATETGPGANTLETAVFDYQTNKWKFLGLTYLADGSIEKDCESSDRKAF